ncbi:MAG: hypothetical protein HRU17_08455 [Polyangiaceae bacterium]|nr:hypothetical protein [Polyangiaceae bacterium]
MPIRPQDFSRKEIQRAVGFAGVIELGLLILMGSADSGASIAPEKEPEKALVPIQITPVVDETPLLKLGSKKKPKLPSMWRRKPTPKKLFEEVSAPAENAEDDPEELPTSRLAELDEEAPPPDASIVKELDEDVPEVDASAEDPEELSEDGDEMGVEEGTETDPLKARVVSLYRMKIIGWFNRRFRIPDTKIPCAELKSLRAPVAVAVNSQRAVASYTIKSSGNAIFDARVRASMDATIGQQLPPPPPKYPDILGTTVQPVFNGLQAKCKVAAVPPAARPKPPAGSDSPPSEPATPTEPAPTEPESAEPESTPEPAAPPAPDPAPAIPSEPSPAPELSE